jgi:5,10-methylenetetrahydromethanopterin reductase
VERCQPSRNLESLSKVRVRRILRDLIEGAKLPEELGFGTFWLPEDPIFPGAFATASAIANNTSKTKIGIGVLNPWTRHPVQTAMEVAALDDIAEGRVVLGLGASVKLWIRDQLGIPYVTPVTALRETVAILNGLLGGDRVDHDGHLLKANGLRATFALPRRHVPIYLGVMAPRALALAGEVADGVLLNSIVSPVCSRCHRSDQPKRETLRKDTRRLFGGRLFHIGDVQR